MALKDWARGKDREPRRQDPEDRDSRLWHSKSYHRFFEGYTEYRVTDERGKTRVRRVYTGTWYRQDLPEGKRRLVRCGYALLFLLMAGTLALAAWGQGSAGRALYAAIPEIVTLCLLARLFYVLFVCYLLAPRKMTVNDYRTSSPALKSAALWLAAAFAADGLSAVVDRLVNGGEAFRSLGVTVLAFCLGGGMALLTARIEQNLPYVTEESAEKAPEGGTAL